MIPDPEPGAGRRPPCYGAPPMPLEAPVSPRPVVPPPASMGPVHAVLFAVQLAFAGFAVVGKLVFPQVEPLAVAGVRVLVAAPALLIFAWRHDRFLPRWRDLPVLALFGLLGICLNQVLFLLGLERTLATNAAILMPSIPVFTVAIAALAGLENIGRRRLLGIALAVLGALVVLDIGSFRFASRESVGILLILGNCLFYAIYLAFQRPLLERFPWRSFIAWSFLTAVPPTLLISGPALAATSWHGISGAAWCGLVFIVLVATVFTYAANTWAVRRSSATLVGVYVTLQPLAAAAIARLALDEPLGSRQLAGFLLIAAGLWRVSTAVARPRSTG